MSAILKSSESISSKILSIGFSSGHDAVFMNKIAQAGSNIGNFIYIDTRDADYKEQIKDALQDSLSIALQDSGAFKLKIESQSANFSEQIKAQKNFVYNQMDEDGNIPEGAEPDIILS